MESNKRIAVESFQIPEKCDVVVIGAGIGGLTTASYLAKRGLNVLILEKHHSVGGCAGSFRHGDYYFDAAAHSLGSCRPDGQLGRLINDHQLNSSLKLIRIDPTDTVLTRHVKAVFRTDRMLALKELQQTFPGERSSIKAFFDYVLDSASTVLYAELYGKSFYEVLNYYFKDKNLIEVFSMLLGNIGLSSRSASAITGVFLYREYIFDGGYYPVGGIQKLADSLVNRFKEYGGKILLLSPVTEIVSDSSKTIKGIKFKHKGRTQVEVAAKHVVVNCSIHELFQKMFSSHLRNKLFKKEEAQYLNKVPSASALVLHLGLKGNLDSQTQFRVPLWAYDGPNTIDDYWDSINNGDPDLSEESFIFINIPSLHDRSLLPSGKHSLQAISGFPFFRDTEIRFDYKLLKQIMLKRVQKYMGDLSDMIEFAELATPRTIYKYTGNYGGAIYGWAALKSQVNRDSYAQPTFMDGLYLVGHWAGLPTGYSGIPSVVANGRMVADLVLRNN